MKTEMGVKLEQVSVDKSPVVSVLILYGIYILHLTQDPLNKLIPKQQDTAAMSWSN